MTYLLKDEGETGAFAAALAAHLKGGDAVYLSGDLGTGKSVLARGILRALGVKDAMPSPTFVLAIPYQGNILACHMDLYRLGEDASAFYDAGLFEYLSEEYVALIEWPMEGIDANVRVEILLTSLGDARRAEVVLFSMDDRAEMIRAALSPWEENR